MNKHNGSYGLDKDQIMDLLGRYQITPTRQRLEIAHYMFQRRSICQLKKFLKA